MVELHSERADTNSNAMEKVVRSHIHGNDVRVDGNVGSGYIDAEDGNKLISAIVGPDRLKLEVVEGGRTANIVANIGPKGEITEVSATSVRSDITGLIGQDAAIQEAKLLMKDMQTELYKSMQHLDTKAVGSFGPNAHNVPENQIFKLVGRDR
jgi:hypothetical protein